MDRLSKELRKLSRKELERVSNILTQVSKGNIDTLQVKQLRGHSHMYRVRTGRLRIIYEETQNGEVKLLAVRFRDDRTYSDF